MSHPDSFRARSSLGIGDRRWEIFRLDAVPGAGQLPFGIKILLENLLRHEDGVHVTAADVATVAAWAPAGASTGGGGGSGGGGGAGGGVAARAAASVATPWPQKRRPTQ
jgi:hypothetical protein